MFDLGSPTSNICLNFGEWMTNVIETRWNFYLSEYFVSDVKDFDWGAKNKWTQLYVTNAESTCTACAKV